MCGEGVCRKLYNYLTYNFLLHIFLHNPNIFITFAVQSNNNHKYNNPPKSKFMIIKHLQGGDNRLLLPPSMQCVARLAIPAVLFAMTACLSSCATQKQGDEIRVHNKLGNGVQL